MPGKKKKAENMGQKLTLVMKSGEAVLGKCLPYSLANNTLDL